LLGEVQRSSPAVEDSYVAKGRLLIVCLVACAFVQMAPAAHAAVPSWVRPALRYMVDHDHITRESFKPNRRMRRAAFKGLMSSVFGGGYRRSGGYVTAAEVAKALVNRLGKRKVAVSIADSTSPDGWDPGMSRRGGFEVVARELGLRYNRSGADESYEASSRMPLRQADVVYAVWKAKTGPRTWAADSLLGFKLDNYDAKRRAVVSYAFSLLGAPYVWAGEWATRTPDGYPYGAQTAGGFDCSGFVWYVVKKATTGYQPVGRPYAGWRLAERSSADMARATDRKIRYRYLKPGDILFFSRDGKDAKPSSVYHTGIYLGKGWMVDSKGSSAGPSLAFIGNGSWWRGQFAWGRRVVPVVS
jgi:cell wall-associated NlpC family hydrolase